MLIMLIDISIVLSVYISCFQDAKSSLWENTDRQMHIEDTNQEDIRTQRSR